MTVYLSLSPVGTIEGSDWKFLLSNGAYVFNFELWCTGTFSVIASGVGVTSGVSNLITQTKNDCFPVTITPDKYLVLTYEPIKIQVSGYFETLENPILSSSFGIIEALNSDLIGVASINDMYGEATFQVSFAKEGYKRLIIQCNNYYSSSIKVTASDKFYLKISLTTAMVNPK